MSLLVWGWLRSRVENVVGLRARSRVRFGPVRLEKSREGYQNVDVDPSMLPSSAAKFLG